MMGFKLLTINQQATKTLSAGRVMAMTAQVATASLGLHGRQKTSSSIVTRRSSSSRRRRRRKGRTSTRTRMRRSMTTRWMVEEQEEADHEPPSKSQERDPCSDIEDSDFICLFLKFVI